MRSDVIADPAQLVDRKTFCFTKVIPLNDDEVSEFRQISQNPWKTFAPKKRPIELYLRDVWPSPWPPRIEAARAITASVFFVSFVPFCSNVSAFDEGCREIQAGIEEDCPGKGQKDAETGSRSASNNRIFPFSSRPW